MREKSYPRSKASANTASKCGLNGGVFSIYKYRVRESAQLRSCRGNPASYCTSSAGLATNKPCRTRATTKAQWRMPPKPLLSPKREEGLEFSHVLLLLVHSPAGDELRNCGRVTSNHSVPTQKKRRWLFPHILPCD